MKRKKQDVVEIKIPKYIKNNIEKITDSSGICKICYYNTNIFDSISKEAVCNKSNHVCRSTRSSLLSCKYFKEKRRSILESFKSLVLAFLCSIKDGNWNILKKAVKYELQN